MRRFLRSGGVLGAAVAFAALAATGCSDDSGGDASGDPVESTVPGDLEVPDLGGLPPGSDGAASPDLEHYVGLTEDEAGSLADEEDRPWRVIEIDGEPQIVTLDFSPDRVNFAITAGVVTAVTTG